jgi:flagellar biogenesis protein FliO
VSLARCGVMLVLLMLVLSPCQIMAQASGVDPASAVAATPLAHLPLQRESSNEIAPGSPSIFLQVGIAFFLVAVLGGLFKVRQRRVEHGGGTPGLRPVRTLRLTQHASLHVVQWHDQELLIACTAQHAELLSQRALSNSPTGSEA